MYVNYRQCSHCMWSRVYVTVCPSVCPSVCPIDHAAAAGLLLWARQDISIDSGGRRAPHQHGVRQKTQAMSRCQLTQAAEHRRNCFISSKPTYAIFPRQSMQAIKSHFTKTQKLSRNSNSLNDNNGGVGRFSRVKCIEVTPLNNGPVHGMAYIRRV